MKIVFLGRDGIIDQARPDHVKSEEEAVFRPGVLDALRLLREDGWTVFVIGNQPVIGENLVPRSTVEKIHEAKCHTVAEHGGWIEAVLYCPHLPEEGCGCRTPRPGLLLRAAHEYRFKLEGTYLIGDSMTDIVAGQTAGCHCIRLRPDHALQLPVVGEVHRDGSYHIAHDLVGAVSLLKRLERNKAHAQRHSPLTHDYARDNLRAD